MIGFASRDDAKFGLFGAKAVTIYLVSANKPFDQWQTVARDHRFDVLWIEDRRSNVQPLGRYVIFA